MADPPDAAGDRAPGTVLGADGATGAYVGAEVAADGTVTWHRLDAGGLVALAGRVTVAAVDMPIGMPESGARACDLLAKRTLGAHHSRVFVVPPRAVLAARDYAEARAIAVRTDGRSLAAQTFGIVGHIRALDRLMTPALQHRLVEAHPELSFAAMAGAPLPSKTSVAGVAARLRLLRGWLPGLDAALEAYTGPARIDDVLDALACAWTARRWAAGVAAVLPEPDEYDARGLRMQIVT